MKAHLVNCTYCTHRRVYREAKGKKYETETCSLTGKVIPMPFQAGRFCEKFHQEGHSCEGCYS